MNWAFNHYWCTQHWPLKESQWWTSPFIASHQSSATLHLSHKLHLRWGIVEDQLRVRMTLTSIIPSHLLVAKVQLFQRVRFGREATHGCMAPGLSSAAAVGWTGDIHGWILDWLGIKVMKIMTSLDHYVRLYKCMRYIINYIYSQIISNYYSMPTIWSSEFECPMSKHSSSKAHLYY